MLADIRVHRPGTLEGALTLLAEPPGGDPLTILAGGTDLMVLLGAKVIAPRAILDISPLDELRGVRLLENGQLEIGALVTFAELGASTLVREHAPLLAEAAMTVGAAQIQARATLGGNVANASPAGDSLPVLLAQGADVVLREAGGERTADFDGFYAGYRQPDVRPGELIVGFRLHALPAGARCRFRKVGTRLAQAISKVAVASVGRLDADGRIDHLSLAAGSVAAVPVRLRTAEAVGVGKTPEEAAEPIVEAVAADVTPIDDIRSTAEYRQAVTARLVARFVAELGG